AFIRTSWCTSSGRQPPNLSSQYPASVAAQEELMEDIENLEEPPPIHRYVAPVEKRRKLGLFEPKPVHAPTWSDRPPASPSPQFTPAPRTGSNTAAILVVVAT